LARKVCRISPITALSKFAAILVLSMDGTLDKEAIRLCSFNLRHQVSEFEDARLTVLPEYLDGAVIFSNHFALSLIENPDYSVPHLQSLGFLRLHLMENAPVTLYRQGARV
jgi:hypothetical protein